MSVATRKQGGTQCGGRRWNHLPTSEEWGVNLILTSTPQWRKSFADRGNMLTDPFKVSFFVFFLECALSWFSSNFLMKLTNIKAVLTEFHTAFIAPGHTVTSSNSSRSDVSCGSFYPSAALFSLKALRSVIRKKKRTRQKRGEEDSTGLQFNSRLRAMRSWTLPWMLVSPFIVEVTKCPGPAQDFFFLTVPHVSVRSHEWSCKEVRPAGRPLPAW